MLTTPWLQQPMKALLVSLPVALHTHYITLHYITLHYITLHYITVLFRSAPLEIGPKPAPKEDCTSRAASFGSESLKMRCSCMQALAPMPVSFADA
jgi:hypothetical protein